MCGWWLVGVGGGFSSGAGPACLGQLPSPRSSALVPGQRVVIKMRGAQFASRAAFCLWGASVTITRLAFVHMLSWRVPFNGGMYMSEIPGVLRVAEQASPTHFYILQI